MKSHEFVSAVIRHKHLNGNALAVELGHPEWQSTISRFLNGKTKDPRQEWVGPAARLLGVAPESFRSEEVANQEATRLGLANLEQPELLPTVRRAPTRIDAGTLALQIADLLRAYDEPVRAAAGPLFSAAATRPDDAPEFARRLRGLLADIPQVTAKQAR